jgi:hypothetical protein
MQSLSWESDSRSAGQETPRILQNPNVHYRVHKSPPLDSILNLLDLYQNLTLRILMIHFNIMPHLRLGSASGLFLSRFSELNTVRISLLPYALFISSYCDTTRILMYV